MRFNTVPSFSRATRATRLAFESLEHRALLAAEGFTPGLTPASAPVYGDANLDGVFNSADLVQVLQAGKYETSEAADWSVGDWNLDGRFDSQDLMGAFQAGAYALDGAKAKEEVPLKGSIQAVESFDYSHFPTLFVDGSGSGNSTHFGRFTVTYEWEVDLQTLVGIGTFHFIAANGDSLFTVATGHAIPTENPDILSTFGMHTIVGGTGRFDGVTGQFIEIGLLNTVTGVTSNSFDGTINK